LIDKNTYEKVVHKAAILLVFQVINFARNSNIIQRLLVVLKLNVALNDVDV